jgi:DNA-directed RNA polymerase subunit RPC12/RpoP
MAKKIRCSACKKEFTDDGNGLFARCPYCGAEFARHLI